MTEKKDEKLTSLLPESGSELFEIPEQEPSPVDSGAQEENNEAPLPAEKPQEAPSIPPALPPQALPPKDEFSKQIEDILSQDLTDMYLSLPEDRKTIFRAKGEEVAATIKTMVQEGKVQVQKILQLIIVWLRLIPGVNKFFLEQEAKIKTDKIMKCIEEERQRITQPLV